jgi:hypothetical protein
MTIKTKVRAGRDCGTPPVTPPPRPGGPHVQIP